MLRAVGRLSLSFKILPRLLQFPGPGLVLFRQIEQFVPGPLVCVGRQFSVMLGPF